MPPAWRPRAVIDTHVVISGLLSFQDATLDTLLQASEVLADMPDCVNAFDEVFEARARDPADFSYSLSRCLLDRQNAAALGGIAALFGVQTSMNAVLEIFTVVTLVELSRQVGDTNYAILAEEFAGQIQFTSLVAFPGETLSVVSEAFDPQQLAV